MVSVSRFMGYKINNAALSNVIELCRTHIEANANARQPIVFSCANPHSLAIAESQQEFREALSNSDILVADGVGLTLVGNLLGANVNPRITGGDFFSALMDQQNSSNSIARTRVFFFGSSEKVLGLLKQNLTTRYPHITFCGFISPPYGNWGDDFNSIFIEKINAARPDILWVGMTAPKQEIWVEKNRNKLNVSVIGNIGAVFDFYAGTYERAPVWARRAGLEWLIRLIKEPRRMWRRNLISPIVFFLSALRYKNKGI